MKDDLTIIVTARERRNTLPRILHYYKDFPCRLILLDGSTEPWPPIQEYGWVEYSHTPNKRWIEKMACTLEQIDTPYTVKLCDDDLLYKHAIPVIIDFLKENPEYHTAMGQEISLLDNHFEYETYEYLFELNQKDHFDNPLDRMKFYWTYFNCKIHSIAKTKTQLEVYKFLLDNPDLYAVRFFDKIWTLIVASRGKFKVLPVLSHMRSRETKSGNVALGENLKSQTRPHLRFENDFLDLDLTKLQEFIGDVDIEFIEEAHSNLCNETKKRQAFLELLDKAPLKTPSISLGGNVGIAQERSINQINSQSNSPSDPSEIYPVYKPESLQAISQMYELFTTHPL
jgi:glycosyltransferase domain-containing protein